MHSDKTRLVKNFFSLASLRGLEFLIPLLTIPYLLRTIGVEKYGLIGFGYAFAAYFGAIAQYGFGVTATRDIARNRQDLDAVSKLYSSAMSTSALLALLGGSVAVLIVLFFPRFRADFSLHLLSLGQVLIQSLFPIWFFQGMERMVFITYLNLAAKTIFIVGLFFLVHGPDDYLFVPILNLCSGLIVLLGSLWITWRVFHVRATRPSWNRVSEMLRCGRHAFINQFAPNLYNNSTTFLLGIVSGSYEVGLYAAATKVVDAVSSVGYILSSTFLPYLSRSIDSHNLFRKIMLLAGFLGTVCLLLGADIIGNLLHPTDGLAIAKLVRMASFSVFMIFVMLTFGTNYLMLKKKEAVAGRISLYTSLFFFLVALVLVPAYGLLGCMLTLVGARTCMALALYINYRGVSLASD